MEKPAENTRRGRLAAAGLVIGFLALLFACDAGRFAVWLAPGEPPPLLQRSDGGAMGSEDVGELARDVAHDLADKTTDLAERGYRRSKRWLNRQLGKEESAPTSAVPTAGNEASISPVAETGGAADAADEPPRRRLRDRFRVNLSSLTDRQKDLIRLFHDCGLFGGLTALVLSVLAWVRREDLGV